MLSNKEFPTLTRRVMEDRAITCIVFDETDKSFGTIVGQSVVHLNSTKVIDLDVTLDKLRLFMTEFADAPYSIHRVIVGGVLSYRQTTFANYGEAKPDFFVLGVPYYRSSAEDIDTTLHTEFIRQWAVVATSFYGNRMLDLYNSSLLHDMYAPRLDKTEHVGKESWFTKLLRKV
jgi:hypothetical protein